MCHAPASTLQALQITCYDMIAGARITRQDLSAANHCTYMIHSVAYSEWLAGLERSTRVRSDQGQALSRGP